MGEDLPCIRHLNYFSPQIKKQLVSGNKYRFDQVSLHWKMKLSNEGEPNEGAIAKKIAMSLIGVATLTIGLFIGINSRLRFIP